MRILAATTMLVVLACAGNPPTTTRYLLPVNVPEGVQRIDPPIRVGLAGIEVAPYLDQPGLVVETEVGQVRPAHRHQWAEPIDLGLKRHLRAELTRALGFEVSGDPSQRHRWDYAVDVSIDRLHGTLAGDAVLVAHWRVTPLQSGRDPVTYRLAARKPLAAQGYPALLDAEIELTRGLAVAIADSVRTSRSEGGADE
jgi:uncharacterized lipoprotein YmbA